jgi:hypothetical protein
MRYTDTQVGGTLRTSWSTLVTGPRWPDVQLPPEAPHGRSPGFFVGH